MKAILTAAVVLICGSIASANDLRFRCFPADSATSILVEQTGEVIYKRPSGESVYVMTIKINNRAIKGTGVATADLLEVQASDVLLGQFHLIAKTSGAEGAYVGMVNFLGDIKDVTCDQI